MDKILLFIPCYNCENQIIKVLKQLDDNSINSVTEILIVDNSSTDSTQQLIIDFAAEKVNLPIKLVVNDRNYSLGGSHKVAFNYAIENDFDYVIVLHGDNQASIADLLPILSNNIYKKYDCCLGSRFMPESSLFGYSKYRIFGNKVFNTLFSWVLGSNILDLGSGLNIYKVNILKNKFYIKYQDDLIFNCCMLLAASSYKHSVCFFPISWKEEGQISNVDMFSQTISIFKMLLLYLIYRNQYLKNDLRKILLEEYSYEIRFDNSP